MHCMFLVQEGTFEVLKEHVVELLSELVSCFSPAQVAFLLERSRTVVRREAADTQRMVGFLGRIVSEDTQVCQMKCLSCLLLKCFEQYIPVLHCRAVCLLGMAVEL